MEKLKANATPSEIGAFLTAIKADAVGRADSYAQILEDGECLLTLYPKGIAISEYACGSGPDWAVASSDLIQKWTAQRNNHLAVTLRKMALEIIRVTADQGECTDRALRLTFDQSEIDELGAEAEGMANEMANNGPFSIKRTQHANAA